MITIINYNWTHMMALGEDGLQECLDPVLDEEAEKLARHRELAGPARTAIINQQILACSGIEIIWPGVAELWALFSRESDHYFMELGRICKNVVAGFMVEAKLHRIQCHVREDFWRGLRLAQFLKFTEEGIARKYTPDGRDCITFSIVR